MFCISKRTCSIQSFQELLSGHGSISNELGASKLCICKSIDRHGTIWLLLQPADESLRRFPFLCWNSTSTAIVLQTMVWKWASSCLGYTPTTVALQMTVLNRNLKTILQSFCNFGGQKLTIGHWRDVLQYLAWWAVLHELFQVVAILWGLSILPCRLRPSAD